MNFTAFPLLLVLLVMFAFSACSDSGGKSKNTDSETTGDSAADTNGDNSIDTGSGVVADSSEDSTGDSDSGSRTDSSNDLGTDSSSGSEHDTGTTFGTDSNTDLTPGESYFVAGDWHGAGWADTGDVAGAIISGLSGDWTSGTGDVCVNGTLAKSYDSVGMLGMAVNQPQGSTAAGQWTPGDNYTGVYVDILKNAPSTVRLQLQDADGNDYCTPITAGGAVLDWSDFVTECWDIGGNVYNPTIPIVQVILIVPGDIRSAVTFDFCLQEMYPIGGIDTEMIDTVTTDSDTVTTDTASGTTDMSDSSDILDTNDTDTNDDDTSDTNDTDTNDDDTSDTNDTDTNSNDTDPVEPDTEAQPEGCVIYVNQADGNDGNDGSTWDTAKSTIPAALDMAEYLECTEIWVAAGTYLATESMDTNISIELLPGIDLYGGFAGGETLRTQRLPQTNITTISGALTSVVNSRVLLVSADDVRIEGFTIEDATTAISGSSNSIEIKNCIISADQGISVFGGSTTIEDTTLQNNTVGITAAEDATVYIDNATISSNRQGIRIEDSTISIANSIFKENVTNSSTSLNYRGAGINAAGSVVTIDNCSFLSNTVNSTSNTLSGGVILASAFSTVTITESTFTDNFAAGSGGAIYTSETSSLSVTGCTFSQNNSVRGVGGAIAVQDVTLLISDCIFTENVSNDSSGGGVFASGGSTVTIQNSQFESNSAKENGGAVYKGGGLELEISDCTFKGNSVTSGVTDEGYGSAVYVSLSGTSATATVSGSTFSKNDARRNGALHMRQGDLVMTDVIFAKNMTTRGALSIGDLATGTVTNGIFVDNVATATGGAIYNTGNLTLVNSLINGNATFGEGGGIYNADRINIQSCTITGNSAPNGNAVWESGLFATADTTTVTNSIIYGNEINVASGAPEAGGITTYSNLADSFSGEGNISDDPLFVNAPDGTTVTTSAGTEDTIFISQYDGIVLNNFIIEIGNDDVQRTVTSVTNDEVTFSPAMADATVMGMRVDVWGLSPTSIEQDYHLQATSPSADNGLNSAATEAYDLDGNARIVNTTVDMGAYEVQ